MCVHRSRYYMSSRFLWKNSQFLAGSRVYADPVSASEVYVCSTFKQLHIFNLWLVAHSCCIGIDVYANVNTPFLLLHENRFIL